MRERPAPPCPRHPDDLADVACVSCQRPLCDACWEFEVDEAPWCRHCVDHVHDRSPAAFPLAFLGGTSTLLAALYLRFRHAEAAFAVAAVAGVGLLVTTGFLLRRALRTSSTRRIVERPGERSVPWDPRGAYRRSARSARLAQIVPPVSGELSALVVLLCLALPVAITPGLLNVSPLIAVEGLLALWWLTFVAVFVVLLYRGSRLADDGPSLTDARDEEHATGGGASTWSGCGDGCSTLDGLGSSGDGGCSGLAALLTFLATLALFVLLAYLLAEFVLPLLFTAAYYVVSRGLRRVANDTHECTGNLPRALGWAIVWASLYTLPLALVVVFAQGILAAR